MEDKKVGKAFSGVIYQGNDFEIGFDSYNWMLKIGHNTSYYCELVDVLGELLEYKLKSNSTTAFLNVRDLLVAFKKELYEIVGKVNISEMMKIIKKGEEK